MTTPHPSKQRLATLFMAIEQEFSQLWEENQALRKQLEQQSITPVIQHQRNAPATQTSHSAAEKSRARLSTEKRGPDFAAFTSALRAGTSKLVSAMRLDNKIEWNAIRRYLVHSDGLWDVRLCPWQPRYLITASADRTATVLDAESGHVVCRYVAHRGSVNTAQAHPTDPLVCTASGDCSVHVWQLAGDPLSSPPVQRLQETEADGDSWTPLVTPPQPMPSAQPASGPNPELQTATVRNCVLSFGGEHAHSDTVCAATWKMDGSGVVTASADTTVKVWSMAGGALEQTLAGHGQAVTNVTVHPHTPSMILSSAKDGAVRLWDIRADNTSVNMINAHAECCRSAVFAAGGTMIVSGGDDRFVKFWDARQLKAPAFTFHSAGAINRMSVEPGGQRVVAPCDDRHCRVYDVSGAYPICLRSQTSAGHKRMVTAAVWSHDSRFIYSSGFDCTVQQWAPPAAKQ